MILILGASGYIGSYLFSRFKKESLEVTGTYFQNKSPGKIYFDLESMSLSDIPVARAKWDYVIISAASNTKIDDCRTYLDYSYKTNVIKTKGIIDYCHLNDIVPVYFSTDHVFDGKKGNYTESDERNPINCYGQMKYEVENYLIESGKSYLILRMSKVFGVDLDDGTLISSMVKNIKSTRMLTCADDQLMTPLFVDDLAQFTLTLIENKYTGIFHLASTKAVTRYEIGLAIQKYFNLDASVNTCKINSFGLLEKRPILTNLNITKYKEITGYKEPEISNFLGMIN